MLGNKKCKIILEMYHYQNKKGMWDLFFLQISLEKFIKLHEIKLILY